MFIPYPDLDPNLDFHPFWIPDLGVKKTPDPNPDPQHCHSRYLGYQLPTVLNSLLKLKTFLIISLTYTDTNPRKLENIGSGTIPEVCTLEHFRADLRSGFERKQIGDKKNA
jgi:hypothetical protein